MVKKTTTKKKYIPNSKEKYMCAKHKKFFTEELLNWKRDIVKSNNLGNILNSSDDNVSSADIVVGAVGIPKFIKSDWIKDNAVVVDAGYHPEKCGDIDLEGVISRSAAYTQILL